MLNKKSKTRKNTKDIISQNVSSCESKKKSKTIILAEVVDNTTYDHFKSLLPNSTNLCKGKSLSGKKYKVHIALSKDFATLEKTDHYKLLYYHNKKEILAYISVKIYERDGGFMFVHKVCSTGGGYGSQLMKIILEDARKNWQQLRITYLSLTTHNLDLVQYYNQFAPTRVEIINNPGSKAQIPKKVAYIIWQLSPDMPKLNFT
jgi:hypothetical protein